MATAATFRSLECMADDGADEQVEDGPDPLTSERRSWHLRRIVAAAVAVAVLASTTVLVFGITGFEWFDSSPDSCAVEAQPSTTEDATPPSVRRIVSDEPVLEWTQVPNPVEGTANRWLSSSTSSPSDGRVYVLTTEDGRSRLLATDDGEEWTELPLPDGIEPDFIQISEDRWVIAGPAVTELGENEKINSEDVHSISDLVMEMRRVNKDRWNVDQVLVSDDHGTTWTSVTVDPQTPPMFLDQHVRTLALMVSGDDIALVTLVNSAIQLTDTLIELGLVEQGEEAGLDRREDENIIAFVTDGSSIYIDRFIEIPLEDLGLTERERQLLNHRDNFDLGTAMGYTRVYAGDASGLGITEELYGVTAAGLSTKDSIVLALYHDRPPGDRFVASTDAQTWDEIYAAEAFNLPGLARANADGTVLASVHNSGEAPMLVSIGCGRVPTPLASFDPPGPVERWNSRLHLEAGLAGIVAIHRSEEFEYRTFEVVSEDGRLIEETARFSGDTERAAYWSPDTHSWHRIDTEAVFGGGVGPHDVRFAVGGDFVLASTNSAEHGDRWFVAKVSQ